MSNEITTSTSDNDSSNGNNNTITTTNNNKTPLLPNNNEENTIHTHKYREIKKNKIWVERAKKIYDINESQGKADRRIRSVSPMSVERKTQKNGKQTSKHGNKLPKYVEIEAI